MAKWTKLIARVYFFFMYIYTISRYSYYVTRRESSDCYSYINYKMHSTKIANWGFSTYIKKKTALRWQAFIKPNCGKNIMGHFMRVSGKHRFNSSADWMCYFWMWSRNCLASFCTLQATDFPFYGSFRWSWVYFFSSLFSFEFGRNYRCFWFHWTVNGVSVINLLSYQK